MVMGIQREDLHLASNMSSGEKKHEIFNGGEESLRRLSQLYNFIVNNCSFRTYTADTCSSMRLTDSKLNRSFRVPRGGPNEFFLLKIDNKFQDHFKLRTIEGRLFSEDDFNSTKKEIPLLLGSDFCNYYDTGDVIINEVGQPYEVIGFLDKSFFHINPLEGATIYRLDKMFIVPLQTKKFETIDYDSAILSTFLITDDLSDLQAIQEKSNELRLYTFDFRSFATQLEHLSQSAKRSLISWGVMISGILFFALTGFISSLMQFIDSRTKEFAVHLLCGARISSIIQRVLIQVFTIIFLSNVFVIFLHKFSLTTLISLLSSLLFGLIVVAYPIIILSKTQINIVLKRSQ